MTQSFLRLLCFTESAFAQDAKLIEAAKKGRQADRLRHHAIGYFRTAAKVLPQENRHHHRLLAHFGNQSHGARAQRSARRQGALRSGHVHRRHHAHHAQGRHPGEVRFADESRIFPKTPSTRSWDRARATTSSASCTTRAIIKPADAPKTLEDLVKPQYRGKLVMADPTCTRRRRNGSPTCTNSSAKTKPTSSCATSPR